MENKTYKIKMFLNDEPQFDDISFVQNDVKSCSLELEFYKNRREKFDLTNCEVVVIIKKNDGTEVIDRVIPTNGKYLYELTNQALSNKGNNKVTIQAISPETERQTFGTFSYKLTRDINTNGIASDTDYPILVSLVSEARVVLANEPVRVANENTRIANEVKRIANDGFRERDYASLKKIIIDENQAANLQNQINKNSSDLADIVQHQTYKSKDLMSYSSDIYTAFNLAMNDASNMSFHLNDGVYISSGTLEFKENKKLILNVNTVIKPTSATEPLFVMNKNCKLIGGIIDCSGFDHRGSAIQFNGNKYECTQNEVRDTKIIGAFGVGSKGIEMISTLDGTMYCMSNQLKNVYITHFNFGIYMESSNGGFCSGNLIDGTIFGASHLVYMKGTSSSGNNLNLMMNAGVQRGDPPYYGIYCEGRYNTFNGYIWDIATHLTNIYCYFTKLSKGNILNPRCINLSGVFITDKIIDEGSQNQIFNYIPYHSSFFPSTSNCGNQSSTSYIGNQDNSFSFLDKNTGRYTLTKEFTSCVEIDNSNNPLNSIFRPNNENSLFVFSDIDNGKIKYTIDFINKEWIQNLAISFGSVEAEVEVYLYNDNTLIKREIIQSGFDAFNSIKSINYSKRYGNPTTNNTMFVNKIDIVISKPSNKNLFLRNIICSTSSGGNSYLEKGGGNMYSDINFDNGKGIVVSTPNNTKKYRIGVDDSGVIISTLIP